MSFRHRNLYRNSVRLPFITAVILLTALGACLGVSMVFSSNHAHALSDEQRKVEHEMKLLRQEIQTLDERIESLLTRDKVYPRLTQAATRLRLISDDAILHVPPASEPARPAEVAQNSTASP